MMNDRMILTPSEAVKLLRIRRSEVYRLLAVGEIPAFKDKNRWRIPATQLEKYINNRAEAEAQIRRELEETAKEVLSLYDHIDEEGKA